MDWVVEMNIQANRGLESGSVGSSRCGPRRLRWLFGAGVLDTGQPLNHWAFAMPAYMFIKTRITDREQYLKYVEAAQPLASKYGRKFLVASQPVQMLEGQPSAFGLQGTRDQWSADYVLVSEWPSAEVARMFWNSEEYAPVRKLREGAGEVHVLLAESLPPPR
jgi:uncharacterized protein (DUF1330 family)